MAKFKEVSFMQLRPGHPGRKWLIFTISLIIASGSVIYTNRLVKEIEERERLQIQLYGRMLEFLNNDSEDPNFFLILDELVTSNTTIPVILTDENENPEQYRNLPKADGVGGNKARRAYLKEKIEEMRSQHEPIEITLRVSDEVYGHKYIFYENSTLLYQLAYYPYIQLTIIGVFVIVVFFLFNYSRTSEQNQVWVGLAKETAHQLGTPLSSLMAWSEYLKAKYPDQEDVLTELDKDIKSLEIITERFSNIGSIPHLKEENVVETVEEIVAYLSVRLSTKIQLTVEAFPTRKIYSKLNKSLFAWVMENLLKNAADAMGGKGFIYIKIMKVSEGITIDVTDTGKGLSKTASHQVFRPGFTTKKRGWGLGLTLAKRIIENYHNGRIYVKSSEQNVGTTFRIQLND